MDDFRTIRLCPGGVRCPLMRLALSLLIAVPLLAVNVTVDGGGAGQTFAGIGGVSAGASSRSLLDYASGPRSDILDFLFKPNFGAALQHLKVEIGGDMNSTDGTEPSHERSNGVISCSRGWEWYLMQQAKARNSSIKLDSLMWGTAGYNSTFYSLSNRNYVKDWLDCAVANSLTIDYTGIWNETGSNTQWIKDLRTTLDGGGYTSVFISADDQATGTYGLANTYNGDSALRTAMTSGALNVHYPSFSTCSTADRDDDATVALNNHGAALWNSEEGFWFGSSHAGQADWTGALYTAHQINCNYIVQKSTKVELWALFSGYYGILPIAGAGQLQANEPWSGHYTVSTPIWAIAHTTQFIQPGWQYLDGATGALNSGNDGSYICAKSSTDYSCVIETKGASGSTTFNFTITGGLSTGTVHVWKSDTSTQFIQQSDIVPSAGAFSLVAAANSIYSITTTTGQAKGTSTISSATSFPFPYIENFETYSTGVLAKYWLDQSGAFETASCTDGHSGTCERQVLTTAPIYWPTESALTHPFTIVGDSTWTDFLVQSDVMIEAAGTATLIGRLGSVTQGGSINGYILHMSNAGVWSVTPGYSGTALSGCSGTTTFGTSTWHALQLKFTGTTVVASLDGVQLCSATDSTYTAGMVGVGTAGYTNAQYDNFKVCATSGCPTFTGKNAGGVASFGGVATR